jgi:hypothetical protein
MEPNPSHGLLLLLLLLLSRKFSTHVPFTQPRAPAAWQFERGKPSIAAFWLHGTKQSAEILHDGALPEGAGPTCCPFVNDGAGPSGCELLSLGVKGGKGGSDEGAGPTCCPFVNDGAGPSDWQLHMKMSWNRIRRRRFVCFVTLHVRLDIAKPMNNARKPSEGRQC